MKFSIASLAAVAGLMAAGSVMAVDLPPVGQKKCATCHAVNTAVVGPAFKDVAAKYKGKKNAKALIAASIKSGGTFGWNRGKMPPRGLGATDDEVEVMAKFIAGLK